CVARPTISPGAGRADRRPRSGVAGRAVGLVRRACPRWLDAARVKPCHGRGRTLRAPAADARGSDPRLRHATRAVRVDGNPHGRGRVLGVGPRRSGGHAVNVRIAGAIALRVLTQLRRDHRTVAMLIVAPCMLMTLLWWI